MTKGQKTMTKGQKTVFTTDFKPPGVKGRDSFDDVFKAIVKPANSAHNLGMNPDKTDAAANIERSIKRLNKKSPVPPLQKLAREALVKKLQKQLKKQHDREFAEATNRHDAFKTMKNRMAE